MRITTLAAALALAVSLPAVSVAQDAEGPIATASTVENPESQRIREAVAYSYDLPKGAPTADYPFVAWCEALVNGHIALGRTLTNADPLDREIVELAQLEAASFRAALDAGASRQSPQVRAEADAAARTATAQWEPLLAQTDEKVRSRAFGLFFGLPGRCEHAARRVRLGVTTPPATLPNAAQ